MLVCDTCESARTWKHHKCFRSWEWMDGEVTIMSRILTRLRNALENQVQTTHIRNTLRMRNFFCGEWIKRSQKTEDKNAQTCNWTAPLNLHPLSPPTPTKAFDRWVMTSREHTHRHTPTHYLPTYPKHPGDIIHFMEIHETFIPSPNCNIPIPPPWPPSKIAPLLHHDSFPPTRKQIHPRW